MPCSAHVTTSVCVGIWIIGTSTIGSGVLPLVLVSRKPSKIGPPSGHAQVGMVGEIVAHRAARRRRAHQRDLSATSYAANGPVPLLISMPTCAMTSLVCPMAMFSDA